MDGQVVDEWTDGWYVGEQDLTQKILGGLTSSTALTSMKLWSISLKSGHWVLCEQVPALHISDPSQIPHKTFSDLLDHEGPGPSSLGLATSACWEDMADP